MPHFRFTSLSKTPTRPFASTMRLSTISVSVRWSWPRQPTVTWTIWYRPQCLALPRAFAFLANSMPIFESSQLTWYRFHDCISSCRALPRLPPVAHSNTVCSRCRSWPNKCSTLKTWWRPATPDTAGIWPWLLFSGEVKNIYFVMKPLSLLRNFSALEIN